MVLRVMQVKWLTKGPFLHILSRVLNWMENHESEMKDLLEQSLAIFKKTDVNSGDIIPLGNYESSKSNIALVTFNLAILHVDMSHRPPRGNLGTP